MQEGEAGEMVKVFYSYLVLFVTLMMVIGGSIGVFISVADYVFPQSYQSSKIMPSSNSSEQTSLAEQKKLYEEMVIADKERIKNKALNGTVKSLGWILIPLPIFIYFQRRIRRKE